MGYPIQKQAFTAFLGTQEGIHSVILPSIYSSSGSKNLYIDKFGRARKILGYAKKNSSAVTTHTGSSATMVRHLQAYRKTNTDGTFTRQLIGVFDDGDNEWEIWYSTNNGESWTYIEDLGASSVGAIPDMAQFNNDLFIVNGVAAPRVWNSSSIASAVSTKSPDAGGAVNTAAGQLTGTYSWKLVSVEADATRHPAGAKSSGIQLQAEQGNVSWTADGDTDVKGYELYRTTGTGAVFYFVTYIDVRTTNAYTDNASDLSIVTNRTLQEHGDSPPTGSYLCEPHKQRMWWGRTNTNPRRVFPSDPDDADSIPLDGYIDFTDAESIGDVLVGLTGNFEGMLVGFLERSIWTVSGSGQIVGDVVDWTRRRSNAQIGCVSGRSVVRIPGGAKYSDEEGNAQKTGQATLAYVTPIGDIRIFDGDNDIIISQPVKAPLGAFNYAHRTKIHALHDTSRSHVVWFFPGSGETEPTEAVVWNYRWGVWYHWPTMPFASAVSIETSSDAQLLLTGQAAVGTGGYTYTFFSGAGFDGSNINAQWMTKTLYGVDGNGTEVFETKKRYRWVDILVLLTGGDDITIEAVSGGAADDKAAEVSKTISAVDLLRSGDGSLILTAEGASVAMNADLLQSIVMLKKSDGNYMTDTGVRLRISDNSQGSSWALEGMTLAYQSLPGHKRRLPVGGA